VVFEPVKTGFGFGPRLSRPKDRTGLDLQTLEIDVMSDGARSWERDEGTAAVPIRREEFSSKSLGDIEQLTELGKGLSKPSP
jgi:hypothetical protein